MISALAFATASCPETLVSPWVESNDRMTWPAIQMEKMGMVLYSELFLAMTDQFRIAGGDHTPTACRNEGEGTVAKMSLRTITKVTSVIPNYPYIS